MNNPRRSTPTVTRRYQQETAAVGSVPRSSVQGRRRLSHTKSWAAKAMREIAEWMRSGFFVVGLAVLLASDILLGALALPGMLAGATPTWRIALTILIPVATSAVQMALWRMAFRSFEKGANLVGRAVMMVVGTIGALGLSLLDTFLDGLAAQLAVFSGATVTVFPPPELASAPAGFHVFWLVFGLFTFLSFFGEPVATFMLFIAGEDDEDVLEEDGDWMGEPLPQTTSAPVVG